MNVGPPVKPVSAARASYAKSDSLSMRTGIATELAPSQTVTVAGNAAAAAEDATRGSLDWQSLSREVLIDPQAREVIYRTLAKRGDAASDQDAPEEATRKLEAYRSAERKPDPDGKVIRTI